LEFNAVRPYTYSHQYPVQNYSHANAPLGHPLGANFKELLAHLQFTRQRLQASMWISNSTRGNDSSTSSFGGNIFKSYNLRVGDQNQLLGQGISQNILHTKFSLSYLINRGNNLRIEFSYGNRITGTSNLPKFQENYWSFGIKTAIFTRPSDF